MKVSRKQLWKGAFWCALFVWMLAGCWSMGSSRERLDEALIQERKCQEMARDIRALLDRPGFAALGIDSPRTITARAEQASKQAKLPAAALVRIEPQVAVRLRDSPYRLRPTRLELRRVTLEQIVSFTHGMIDEAQGTTVRDLRLALANGESRRSGEQDLWSADLLLTQLIFSPVAR